MNNSSAPATGNPQNNRGSIDSQSNVNVQDVVDQDALRTEQQELKVVSTGQPASQSPHVMSVSSSYTSWIVITSMLIAIGIFVLIKLIREADDESIEEVVEVPKVKQVVKKKSIKKRSSPNQRKKKTSIKKR